MEIIKTVEEMQIASEKLRMQGKRIAFVPTMGFLHEGHLSLIDIAHKNADIIVVSIYVNPTQFAPGEDLDKYPRDFKKDCRLCDEKNVDIIFNPENIYDKNHSTWVIEESLGNFLCGKSRPTHFKGVTTIVAKLFNIVLPHVAVFGNKDAQQAIILKRMVRDLNFPIKIITAPIVREKDGLAMSSRNKYLINEQRKNALSIFRGLQKTEKFFKNGERNAKKLEKIVFDEILETGGEIDYIEIRQIEDLEHRENIEMSSILAVAAYFGTTRLIDNVELII